MVVGAGGSPPRARGTDHRRREAAGLPGITPACAGNRWPTSCSSPPPTDHPRVRGEQGPQPTSPIRPPGSPPRARGTVAGCLLSSRPPGITPACAGNSVAGRSARRGGTDHPRVRGEQERAARTRVSTCGSPPRARGTAATARRSRASPGIIPACAGNRKEHIGAWVFASDHPRVRGEQHPERNQPTRVQGSPPRARGTAAFCVWSRGGSGITPACAGNRPRSR